MFSSRDSGEEIRSRGCFPGLCELFSNFYTTCPTKRGNPNPEGPKREPVIFMFNGDGPSLLRDVLRLDGKKFGRISVLNRSFRLVLAWSLSGIRHQQEQMYYWKKYISCAKAVPKTKKYKRKVLERTDIEHFEPTPNTATFCFTQRDVLWNDTTIPFVLQWSHAIMGLSWFYSRGSILQMPWFSTLLSPRRSGEFAWTYPLKDYSEHLHGFFCSTSYHLLIFDMNSSGAHFKHGFNHLASVAWPPTPEGRFSCWWREECRVWGTIPSVPYITKR